MFGADSEGSPGSEESVDFAVTYHGNGNTRGNVPVDDTDYSDGDAVTVTGNPGELVGDEIKDGIAQRFVSWKRSADGRGEPYVEGDTFTITGDVDLYAVYTEDSDVTGKVGPGNGIVFHDSGSAYYAAAPAGWSGGDDLIAEWGSDSQELGSDGDPPQLGGIGDGDANTTVILDNHPGASYAANLTQSFQTDVEGVTCDSWFLPSEQELEAMHGSLHAEGIGGFTSGEDYWSSTAASSSGADDVYARAVTFDGGTADGALVSKAESLRVRPVRSF